jgi:hypothetical protein
VDIDKLSVPVYSPFCIPGLPTMSNSSLLAADNVDSVFVGSSDGFEDPVDFWGCDREKIITGVGSVAAAAAVAALEVEVDVEASAANAFVFSDDARDDAPLWIGASCLALVEWSGMFIFLTRSPCRCKVCTILLLLLPLL